jgi:hypothetical protein
MTVSPLVHNIVNIGEIDICIENGDRLRCQKIAYIIILGKRDRCMKRGLYEKPDTIGKGHNVEGMKQ